jgi:NADH dehydrogenase FAD-containing subunit
MALADEAYASKAWVKFQDLAALRHPAVNFIQGSIQTVNCEKLAANIKVHASGESVSQKYDYLVAATGLRRPWPVVPQSLTREAYLKETKANIDACKSAAHGVVVIGGGAVGVEMAAELKLVQPNTHVTLIHSRSQLLSAEPLPDTFKDAIAPLVCEAGVDSLLLSTRVNSITPSPTEPSLQLLTLSDSTTLTASHVLSAISHPTPTTTYLPAAALDTEGFVKIAPTLHFPSDTTSPPNATLSQRHFAVGDIAAWSGIKRCGAAMHMGHFAAYNIHQQLLEEKYAASLDAEGNAAGRVYKAKFMSLSEHPNVLGLAVGRKAITYSEAEGVKSGEDVEKLMFGGDLGWSICWNYLGLGREDPGPAEDQATEGGKMEASVVVDGEGELQLQKLKLGEKEGLQGQVAVVASAA